MKVPCRGREHATLWSFGSAWIFHVSHFPHAMCRVCVGVVLVTCYVMAISVLCCVEHVLRWLIVFSIILIALCRATMSASYQVSFKSLKNPIFRIRAPILIFFISTHRYFEVLQLSFRSQQLILNLSKIYIFDRISMLVNAAKR